MKKEEKEIERMKKCKTAEAREIRRLWRASGMPMDKFSEFLDIPANTIKAWLYGSRKPAPYIMSYINLKLEKLSETNSKIKKERK